MWRTDLTDLINERDAWAFIGSGISADSGCPTWKGLLDAVVSGLDDERQSRIQDDARYKASYTKKDFAKCLGRVEYYAGRNALERSVASSLGNCGTPGALSSLLADWPFRGYVTTNYDDVIEKSIERLGDRGWLSVGNSSDELRMVSGDADRIVWHIHGATTLPTAKSRLILTDMDYDNLYAEGSPFLVQLKGLLAQHRVVFFGFGFEDHELMRLLKTVGRRCNPARPAFAFVSGLSGTESEAQRYELLEDYNVDVIPYRLQNGSHKELVELLQAYNALVVPRSMPFSAAARPCPSYDPETTGLLLYNSLALKGEAKITEDIQGALLRTFILSLLRHTGPVEQSELERTVGERVAILNSQPPASQKHREAVAKAVDELAILGYVAIVQGAGDRQISLTADGARNVESQSATSQRLAGQFSSSLASRARERFPNDAETADRLARTAESFLKECAQRRALGVAMAWNSPRLDFQNYHITALLQALPQFMKQLSARDEARALVGIVRDILARPSQAESRYLGLLIQAQFGVHLLGFDPDTLRVRAREVEKTLFVIDSSTLIPFFAKSSLAHDAGRFLIDRLRSSGALVATTTMLSDEVAEHAQWPVRNGVVTEAGHIVIETVKAAKGSAGYKSNDFLEGFLSQASQGASTVNYLTYLDQICGCRITDGISDKAFRDAIDKEFLLIKFEERPGFAAVEFAERDDVQSRIAERRKAAGTFTHDRQVKAEAEVLIMVRDIRRATHSFGGHTVTNAYFASKTRAIDYVWGSEPPVTMRPEAILQWLATITQAPADELVCLVNGILWELSERDMAIVDKQRLQTVFSPLIAASKEQLDIELNVHKMLISHRYGESAEAAFHEVKDIDLPIVMESYRAQVIKQLQERLAVEQTRVERLQASSALTQQERARLATLEAEKKQRQLKDRKRKRRSASRRTKRRT